MYECLLLISGNYPVKEMLEMEHGFSRLPEVLVFPLPLSYQKQGGVEDFSIPL